MTIDQLERLGELLIEEGAVTQEEMAQAVADAGAKGTAIAALLMSAKHPRRMELAAFLATDFQVPRIEDLRKVDIGAEAVKLVAEGLARKHEMVPVAKIGGILCVAKPNYFNRAAVQDLRRATGLKVKVVLADEDQVRAAIERAYAGKTGELPAPKASKTDTAAFRAAPPAVEESQARDAIPLISVDASPASKGPALQPSKVAASEFQEQERQLSSRMVAAWDELFLQGRPVHPIRVG